MALTVLPDPNNKINAAGQPDAGGSPGPGYANVALRSKQPIMKNRTNSGRVTTRGLAAQYWEVDIQYNPMTRSTFDVIYSYLLNKRGGLISFLVSLPQYLAPKDITMVTNPVTNTLADAGSSTIAFNAVTGAPQAGDLFVVEDPLDSAHTKAYVVTGIDAGPVIYFSPPLAKEVSSGSTLRFQNPLIKVLIISDIQEYALNRDNLYSFSLKLEEAQA